MFNVHIIQKLPVPCNPGHCARIMGGGGGSVQIPNIRAFMRSVGRNMFKHCELKKHSLKSEQKIKKFSLQENLIGMNYFEK